MIDNGQYNSSPLLIWIWISRTRFMSLKLVDLKEKKVHKICLNLVEHHHCIIMLKVLFIDFIRLVVMR